MMSFEEIKSEYVFYVAGNPANWKSFNLRPFGKGVTLVDGFAKHSGSFLDLINQLNGIAYGSKSMAMPKWVALDCAIIPSAFVGLAKPIEKVPHEILSNFDFPTGYSGLVPLSEYCAIPLAYGDNSWIGYSCATIESGKKLGLFSKLLALTVYKSEHFTGVCQYDNLPALKLHTSINGSIELQSTIAHAHAMPEITLIYSHKVAQNKLASVFGAENECTVQADKLLNPYSVEEKQELQNLINGGSTVSILYPGYKISESGALGTPIVFG